jgi:hypothetical protein
MESIMTIVITLLAGLLAIAIYRVISNWNYIVTGEDVPAVYVSAAQPSAPTNPNENPVYVEENWWETHQFPTGFVDADGRWTAEFIAPTTAWAISTGWQEFDNRTLEFGCWVVKYNGKVGVYITNNPMTISQLVHIGLHNGLFVVGSKHVVVGRVQLQLNKVDGVDCEYRYEFVRGTHYNYASHIKHTLLTDGVEVSADGWCYRDGDIVGFLKQRPADW